MIKLEAKQFDIPLLILFGIPDFSTGCVQLQLGCVNDIDGDLGPADRQMTFVEALTEGERVDHWFISRGKQQNATVWAPTGSL